MWVYSCLSPNLLTESYDDDHSQCHYPWMYTKIVRHLSIPLHYIQNTYSNTRIALTKVWYHIYFFSFLIFFWVFLISIIKYLFNLCLCENSLSQLRSSTLSLSRLCVELFNSITDDFLHESCRSVKNDSIHRMKTCIDSQL